MKKTLFAIASLALLAMGCVKEQQPSSPADSAEVTSIKITVEQTKVSVNETTGVCTWQAGDQIAVWYQGADAGQKVIFTYKGLHEDGSAEFTTTESITDGYVATKVAHPVGSITDAGTFGLVRDYTYDVNRIPVYLRSEEIVTNTDGSLSAQLTHNATIMQFTLRDIPAYAAGFVVQTSGNIKIKTSFPYKTGYSEDIVLNTVVPHSRTAESFYLIDGDGDVIEGSVKTFKNSPTTVKGEFLKMGLVDFKKANLRKDYVKVCGVKWAKGNLQCISTENTDGATGFQKGWRIAPYQWHNLQYKEASTASGGQAKAYGYTNSSDAFEHFNHGGIARQARFVSAGNFIAKPVSDDLDISGKMYSDIEAKTELTGDAAFKEIDSFASTNHNEMWGDIAYWASKGLYRMPKNTEMLKLHNASDKLAGYIKTPDGSVVYGYLYRTPNTQRITNGTDQEFTEADLESGLFLPKAGRRGATASSSGTIINVMTQGMYKTGTYVKSVTNNGTEYYCSAYYSLGDAGKLCDDNLKVTISSVLSVGYANSHAAGHLVRPVYTK